MKSILALLLLAGCSAPITKHCSCEKQIDYIMLAIEGKVAADEAACLIAGARELDIMDSVTRSVK